MPHYIYNGQDNKPDFAPRGEYIGTIVWAKDKTTDWGEEISVLFAFDGDRGSAFDNLQFQEAKQWKIDVFLKATGHTPKDGPGAEVELTAKMVKGWRAWLDIGVEDDRKVEGKKKNVILKYLPEKGVPEPLPF